MTNESNTLRRGETPLRLAVIIGSNREERFGATVAEWFLPHAANRTDLRVDVIDVADLALPVAYPRRRSSAIDEYAARLGDADAFVVITPEYNHGYPAGLKQAIDLVQKEWHAKPVGFVSYGGMAGGLRAVEQLRQVFAELHAVTVRDTVSLHNPWGLVDDTGALHVADAAEAAAKTMLDELIWWGNSLRTARETRPYAA